jgi:hypothetical protein
MTEEAPSEKKKPYGCLAFVILSLLLGTCSMIFRSGDKPPPSAPPPAGAFNVPPPFSPPPKTVAQLAQDVIEKAEYEAPTVGSEILDAAGHRAEKEARSYLIKCGFPRERQFLCLQNQQIFIEDYVRAKAEDYRAIGNIAAIFQGPWRGSPNYKDALLRNTGFPYSPLQACAWRIVQSMVPNSEDENISPYLLEFEIQTRAKFAQDTCAKLPTADQAAGRRRAEILLQELNTAPVRRPPFNWDPSHHGAPTPQPPQGILDSTVTPRSGTR